MQEAIAAFLYGAEERADFSSDHAWRRESCFEGRDGCRGNNSLHLVTSFVNKHTAIEHQSNLKLNERPGF